MDAGCVNKNDYRSPWPLNESYYLICNGQAVHLLDKFGNQNVVWNKNGGNAYWWCQTRFVIPVKPQLKPPVLTTGTWQGERAKLPDHKKATLSVTNIYESDFTWPADVLANKRIKELRIIQIIPKPWSCPVKNTPTIGKGNGALALMVLGTAPVESDGSVYCEAPVERELYFQAIDDKGMAVQGMRSGAYVHPGEQLSCTGCHEDKWKAFPPPAQVPLAFRRAPSKITPEVEGSCPYSYYRLAKPVIEGKCVPCHKSAGKGFQSWFNYDWSMPDRYLFFFHTQEAQEGLGAVHGGYRTIAGKFGAFNSDIGRALLTTSHQNALASGKFTAQDMRRVTLWLDCNSNELGSSLNVDAQRRGEIVWPTEVQWDVKDVDPANPTGVEQDYTAIIAPGMKARTPSTGYALSVTSMGLLRTSATIRFAVPPNGQGMLRISISDAHGRMVRTMVDGTVASGGHTVIFDGRGDNGTSLAPGLYICRMTAPGFAGAAKLVTCGR
jgi:hypothetical protein